MRPVVAGKALQMSREQAENLLRYPELLARTIDMLQQALDHQTSQMTGEPGETFSIMILGERIVLEPEEGDTP